MYVESLCDVYNVEYRYAIVLVSVWKVYRGTIGVDFSLVELELEFGLNIKLIRLIGTQLGTVPHRNCQNKLVR